MLVAVRAVSLNASDCEFLAGRPLYTRMWGLWKPKHQVLGSDLAGEVRAVGPGVTRFQAGDAVFGDAFERWGGLAELAAVQQERLIAKPEGLSFEHAAALPQAALVALQGLRDEGKVQPGQRVLINGAGGGSGTFAIQIAKHLGADVTGVDSAAKLDLMRALGADQVIDYAAEDYHVHRAPQAPGPGYVDSWTRGHRLQAPGTSPGPRHIVSRPRGHRLQAPGTSPPGPRGRRSQTRGCPSRTGDIASATAEPRSLPLRATPLGPAALPGPWCARTPIPWILGFSPCAPSGRSPPEKPRGALADLATPSYDGQPDRVAHLTGAGCRRCSASPPPRQLSGSISSRVSGRSSSGLRAP